MNYIKCKYTYNQQLFNPKHRSIPYFLQNMYMSTLEQDWNSLRSLPQLLPKICAKLEFHSSLALLTFLGNYLPPKLVITVYIQSSSGVTQRFSTKTKSTMMNSDDFEISTQNSAQTQEFGFGLDFYRYGSKNPARTKSLKKIFEEKKIN